MVFRVRSQQGQHYALKRTCVSNNQDLAVCKREITIVVSVKARSESAFRAGFRFIVILSCIIHAAAYHISSNVDEQR